MGCSCSKLLSPDTDLATLGLAPLPDNLLNVLVDFHVCWDNFITGKNPSYRSFVHPPEELAIDTPSSKLQPSNDISRPQVFWFDEMYHLLIVESSKFPHPNAAQLSDTVRNRSLYANVGAFSRFTRMLMDVMVHCHEDQIRIQLEERKKARNNSKLNMTLTPPTNHAHTDETAVMNTPAPAPALATVPGARNGSVDMKSLSESDSIELSLASGQTSASATASDSSSASSSSSLSSSASPSSASATSSSSPDWSMSLLSVSNLAIIAAKHNRAGIDLSLLSMLHLVLPKLYRRCFGSAYQEEFDVLLQSAYENVMKVIWKAQQMEKAGHMKEYLKDGEDLDSLAVKF